MASIFPYSEFPYRIVTLDGDNVREHLALATSIVAANAAFYAMVPERPGGVVLMMQGSRIIHDSREMEPKR